MRIDNIILVGTSHVATQSVKEVEAAIAEFKPSVIALELDPERLQALLHPTDRKMRLRDIRHVGVTGYVFSLLGAWAERMLGEQAGTKPGDDMLSAVRLAQQHHIPLALVDQNIRLTLKRLSKEVTWREKARFVRDILRAALSPKKKLPFDLRTVPNQTTIDMMIREVRKAYPTVYRVLVQERNDVMAKRLAALGRRDPDARIVAVLGAGHVREIGVLVRRYLAQSI